MQKEAQIGAARRSSPPWYGFKANLAIVALQGIATPSILRLKRR
jgi:hypothetical protein